MHVRHRSIGRAGHRPGSSPRRPARVALTTGCAVVATAAAVFASVGIGSGAAATRPTATASAAANLPYDAPATAPRPGNRLVFAHYFTPYPISLDNKAPASDYYTTGYLNPDGEGGKHSAYGGLLRDRPIGRAPLSGDWRAADLETEVRQATAAGLDGFTVDLLNVRSTNWDRTIALLNAAQRVDPTFKIMLMPDMTDNALGDESSASIAAAVAQLAKYPSTFKLGDGRVVVSPFKAENRTAAWWKTWLADVAGRGVKVALVPTFLNLEKNVTAFAPISYGFSVWGTAKPMSADTAASNAQAAHSRGKIWMAPVRTQDERPNQAVYDEAEANKTLRSSWMGAITPGAEWVQIPTWNDYSEGGAIAPSVGHGWSFLDVSGFYQHRFRTGSWPRLVRDGLYLTHRTQLAAAKPQIGTKLMQIRPGGTPQNIVEASLFLTAPATVTVSVGGKRTSWSAPAGTSSKVLPLQVGNGVVSGSVVRSGKTTTAVTSPYKVTSTPKVQDLQYHSVSSLR